MGEPLMNRRGFVAEQRAASHMWDDASRSAGKMARGRSLHDFFVNVRLFATTKLS